MDHVKLESKYFDKFQKLMQQEPGLLNLRGSTMLVEVLEYEIKKGSIVIAQAQDQTRNATHSDKGVIAMVLAVGSGYYDEEGEDVPLDIKPGALILCSPHSLLKYSYFPGLNDVTSLKLAITKESEIRVYYESMEAFVKASEVLNG